MHHLLGHIDALCHGRLPSVTLGSYFLSGIVQERGWVVSSATVSLQVLNRRALEILKGWEHPANWVIGVEHFTHLVCVICVLRDLATRVGSLHVSSRTAVCYCFLNYSWSVDIFSSQKKVLYSFSWWFSDLIYFVIIWWWKALNTTSQLHIRNVDLFLTRRMKSFISSLKFRHVIGAKNGAVFVGTRLH